MMPLVSLARMFADAARRGYGVCCRASWNLESQLEGWSPASVLCFAGAVGACRTRAPGCHDAVFRFSSALDAIAERAGARVSGVRSHVQ